MKNCILENILERTENRRQTPPAPLKIPKYISKIDARSDAIFFPNFGKKIKSILELYFGILLWLIRVSDVVCKRTY